MPAGAVAARNVAGANAGAGESEARRYRANPAVGFGASRRRGGRVRVFAGGIGDKAAMTVDRSLSRTQTWPLSRSFRLCHAM